MKYSAMLNAAWMMSEKIASIFGVIFVTSFVAKSFGPDIFGKVAITVSLFSIVQTVAIFDTKTILFKTMSDCQKEHAADDLGEIIAHDVTADIFISGSAIYLADDG